MQPRQQRQQEPVKKQYVRWVKQLPPRTESLSNFSIHSFAVAVRLQLRVPPSPPGVKIIAKKVLKNAITYLKSDFLAAVAIIVALIYCLFCAQNTT